MKRIESYTLLGWEADVRFEATKAGRKDYDVDYSLRSFTCGNRTVTSASERTLYTELVEFFEEHSDFLSWTEEVEQEMIEELEQGSESDD